MININLLKSKMVQKGYTQAEFCKEINMSKSTFIRKMKNGTVTFKEAERMIEVLDIKNPTEIFFAKEGEVIK